MGPKVATRISLRVQIQRRLYLCVTQKALHGLGFHLAFVHQPVAQVVTQVVKSLLSYYCFKKVRAAMGTCRMPLGIVTLALSFTAIPNARTSR
jgi:hypothetical protein